MLTFLCFIILCGFLAFGDDFGSILLAAAFYLACVLGPIFMMLAYT